MVSPVRHNEQLAAIRRVALLSVTLSYCKLRTNSSQSLTMQCISHKLLLLLLLGHHRCLSLCLQNAIKYAPTNASALDRTTIIYLHSYPFGQCVTCGPTLASNSSILRVLNLLVQRLRYRRDINIMCIFGPHRGLLNYRCSEICLSSVCWSRPLALQKRLNRPRYRFRLEADSYGPKKCGGAH